MITSDLMVVDWEDIICGRPRYGGQDGHDMIDTDSSDPNVRKRMDRADLGYMCRTVVQDQRWSDTDDSQIRTTTQTQTPSRSWNIKLGKTHAHGGIGVRWCIFRRD